MKIMAVNPQNIFNIYFTSLQMKLIIVLCIEIYKKGYFLYNLINWSESY